MASGHGGPYGLERDFQDAVGHRREVIGQCLHLPAPVQILHQKAKQVGMVNLAQRIHLPFDIRPALMNGLAYTCTQFRQKCVVVGRTVHGAGIQQFIKDDRMLAQIVRGPGGCAHQVCDARKRPWKFVEQCEIGGASTDGFQQLGQSGQCLLGIRRLQGNGPGLGKKPVAAGFSCGRSATLASDPHQEPFEGFLHLALNARDLCKEGLSILTSHRQADMGDR